MITKFFKGMQPYHITQGFHDGHQGLDIIGSWGTALTAPEDCLILGIKGDTFTNDESNTLKGYGVRFKGIETGHEYLYWHCLPHFPVWGGDRVSRGDIVAFMGNYGYVTVGGKEVPVNKRLEPGKPGTHLHVEVEKDGVRIDPTNLIQWNWEPQWGITAYIKALSVVLQKMARAVK